jgi:hypothetical protein
VFPQPGVLAPPFTDPAVQGFVLPVADFDQYGAAIASKIQAVTNTPEPTTLGVGLIGLGFAAKLRKSKPLPVV